MLFAPASHTHLTRPLLNLRVQRKVPLAELPQLSQALEEGRQSLGETGRFLVRYSGTEAKLRILVEARDADDVQYWSDRLAAVAEDELTDEC